MRYGSFDDSRREYVIDTPRTPLPWINYLGDGSFFSLVSNTAGGYSFYRDARLRRITRYRYNDVPSDGNGRYLYIRDGEAVWNPGWKPVCAELDSYRCRHGMGYTVFESGRNGLSCELTILVPEGEDFEIQRAIIENRSAFPKDISVWGSVEFCLWNAWDDQTNFQRNLSTGECAVEASEGRAVIYHLTEYRERRNHYAWFAALGPVNGFESDRDSFLGPDGGWAAPRAVFEDDARNSQADGWSPMGAHRFRFRLEPGEKREIRLVLGYSENDTADKWTADGKPNLSKARAAVDRASDSDFVVEALGKLQRNWEDLLGRFQVESASPELDRGVNIWIPRQCAVVYHFARSASYYESGIGRGIGFRDTCQDLLGFVHMLPGKARARLLAVAAIQFEDGGAYHQFQPLTGLGNADVGGNFNDDPLWLIMAAAAYIKETGDWTLLDESVPFDNDPAHSASFFEHLARAFHKTASNLGPHGLPLIGRADWNDCLNLNCFSENPDESFQTSGMKDGRIAESVFIAGLLVWVAPEMERLAVFHGNHEFADEVRGSALQVRKALEDHGWDGEWYRRAYDAEGRVVGGAECPEGSIYLEPQGMCAMAGVGSDKGWPKAALRSVVTRMETPYGLVLLDPPYSKYHKELGEVSSYPPGYKENGGIFCHSNAWPIIAAVQEGKPEDAWRWYRSYSPGFLDDRSELHRTEPYVYSQMTAGKGSARHGESKNSWLTGTAAWGYVAATQWILGVRPDWDGLVVEPCLPAAIPAAHITRRWRGASYEIDIGRVRGLAAMELSVDGKRIKGHTVPVASPGARVRVTVRVP
jgi:cellobiose phosphorylase